MEILRSGDLVDVPWKNGGGTTREIATGRIGNRTAWRISRADVVQDGAFSDFTGMTRILTVVSGAGMMLQHADGEIVADPWQPVAFDGALKIASRLVAGPLTDLNLMFDPQLCTATVLTRRGPATQQRITMPDAGLIACHVLAGCPKIGDVTLGVADTAFVSDPVPLVLSDGDALLEIRLSYPDQSSAIKFCIALR